MLFYPLNHNLFFMGFDSSEEASWVMENGSRIFRGEVLHLEWWTPSTGCTGRKGQDQEAWIIVIGLPLHLWTEEILKKVGDSYGGFVALDKETTIRTDLLWARILVKMNNTGKPSSVNLLAGARSYELQIWWEIQPRVAEVYPRRNRIAGVLEEPREEDERKTRAAGHVSVERGETSHAFREEQRDVGQQESLEKRGSAGGLPLCPKRVGIPKEGPTPQFEIQKNMGLRSKEEGVKISQDTTSYSPSPYQGCVVGQSPSPSQGVFVGQSPRSYREQVVRPTKISLVDQRVKCMGLLVEKTKGAMYLSFASLQECGAIVVEEGGYQEKLPTQTLGQCEDNNTNWGLSREERRILKEAKGSRIEEKGSSLFASDRDLTSGKVPRETLSSVDLGVGGEEGGSSAGEKMQSFSPLVDGISCGDNDPEYKTQLGREIKPISRSPNIPGEISTSSGLEVEGDDVTRAGRSTSLEVESLGKIEGTWPVSSGRVRWTRPKSQEQVDHGSSQACGWIAGRV